MGLIMNEYLVLGLGIGLILVGALITIMQIITLKEVKKSKELTKRLKL
jgi:hypothetical protein